MKRRQAEIIIVGSGAGGSALAKELSGKGRQVTVIEAGKKPTRKLGTLRGALSLYDKFGLLRSKEGIFLYRAITPGGTTVVSCGCGIRSLQEEFLEAGINLEKKFIETEKELKIVPLPKSKIKGGSLKILESALKLGYQMRPMPKFVNLKKCIFCGNCVLGCEPNAKWTANCYLNQAIKNGASLLSGIKVTRILHSNGKATGVEVIGPSGLEEIMAEKIILSAGGLGTPVILQKSGILNAGQKLFCDLFNVTYGATEETNNLTGINMALIDYEFYESKRFILSSFIDPLLQFQFFTRLKFFRKKCLGIMTKVADESVGRVDINGNIEKSATLKDRKKLNEGAEIAKKILVKAGVNPMSMMTTSIRGAHPGGTAAVREVVDENLETEIKNLFVCDASVFPIASGLPPILTIIALAKWFSKKIMLSQHF